MTFDLHYLIDNGTLKNWETGIAPNCTVDEQGSYIGERHPRKR